MKYAIEVDTFKVAEAHQAEYLIKRGLERAKLQRHSDYVSRVILLATSHYQDLISELAQATIRHTGCMNIWGGCVAGLICQGKAIANEPALLIAVFDGDFEPTEEANSLNLLLAQQDPEHEEEWRSKDEPLAGLVPDANSMGLLSYGANYSSLHRLEHGRLVSGPLSRLAIKLKKPRIYNSEGLAFLTDALVVTECAGKFLLKVADQLASTALEAPQAQTVPVGLRLQVIRDNRAKWVAVMQLLADGTMALAEPIQTGDKVRLAIRSAKASQDDLTAWLDSLENDQTASIAGFGILMAGFERSQMCHEDWQDIETLCLALPNVQWIGILGQAAWLTNGENHTLPARNNRLTMCLIPDNV